MPGFVIPNAPQTGTAAYYGFDQAEPDTLDFSILGNRRTGVLTGGLVTAPSVAAATVNVSAMTALINGVTVTTNAVSALSVGSADGSANRFDLIIARLSGSTATITLITGTADATNPVLPPTTDYLSAIGSTSVAASQKVDLSTDLVLAAIYRPAGDSNVISKLLVDKRVMVSNITLSGSGVPAAGLGVAGDAYADTSAGDPPAGGSKLYVKETTSGWRNIGAFDLASTTVPIGTTIIWPGLTPPDATTYKSANGQSLSKTTYATLYSLLKGVGATCPYGESLNDFNLPNYNNAAFIKGGATPSATTGGANSVTLTTSNMPQHDHTMAHTHTHTHTHTLNAHNHTISGTIYGGAHTHYVTTTESYSAIRANGFVTQTSGLSSGGNGGFQLVENANNEILTTYTYAGAHNQAFAASESAGSFDPNHSHSYSLTASDNSTNTSAASTATTSAASVSNTGYAGQVTPTAINTLPFHYTVTFYIKVL